MTDRHCCSNCGFGEMIDMMNMDELVCKFESPNDFIVTHPYHWSCLKWKEIESIPLEDHVKVGFNRWNINIWKD